MDNFLGFSAHWGDLCWNLSLKILPGAGPCSAPGLSRKHRGQGPGFDSRGARVQHILLDIDDEKDEPEEHKDDEDDEDEDDEDDENEDEDEFEDHKG